MVLILAIIQIIAGIASFVCYILVVVAMFQNDEALLGILCIVLCGPLFAFVMGWIKAGEMGINNIMLAWTTCVLIGLVCTGLGSGL